MRTQGADPFALLQTGLAHQRAGRLADAARLYQQVLARAPHDANALNLLGLVRHLEGDNETARALLERAVGLRPDSAIFLGNLGAVLMAKGQLGAAEARLRAALAKRPDDPVFNRNLAGVLYHRGDAAAAARHYERTLFAAPSDADAHLGLAHAQKALGQAGAAAASCRAALDLRPDHAEARFLLAALEQRDVPDRPPASYVRAVFDAYAERFEHDLVKNLGYRIPEEISALVVSLGDAAPAAVLDLGCGTGLCGAALRGRAKRLVGIDVSAHMLAKAREQNIYDELLEGDILDIMPTLPAGSFDLICAADVFNYLGDLAPVLVAAARLLASGGQLVFSTERASEDEKGADDGTGYLLTRNLRYAHVTDFVRRAARAAGLGECAWKPVAVRLERNAPVSGDLFLFRR